MRFPSLVLLIIWLVGSSGCSTGNSRNCGYIGMCNKTWLDLSSTTTTGVSEITTDSLGSDEPDSRQALVQYVKTNWNQLPAFAARREGELWQTLIELVEQQDSEANAENWVYEWFMTKCFGDSNEDCTPEQFLEQALGK